MGSANEANGRSGALAERAAAAAERDAAADAIIQKHVMFSMLTGGIPLPVVDLAAGTAVQLDLLKRLSQNYKVTFDGRSSRTFLTSVTVALAANAAGRAGASAAKGIPGVGWLAGGIAGAGLTGASTYAIGNLAKSLFRDGRALAHVDVGALKGELKAYFDKGLEVAKEKAASVQEKAASVKDKVRDAVKRKRGGS